LPEAQIALILLYAPFDGRSLMESLLAALGLSDDWTLMPMLQQGDLQSSDLGGKLTDALVRAREEQQSQSRAAGPVVFVGMDSPETPLDEIASVFTQERYRQSALLCPAQDGGYGMLAVPPSATAAATFTGIRWSHSLTAVSQLKALTDDNVPVRIGRLMHDVDEPEDVLSLMQRLKATPSRDEPTNDAPTDVLLRSSHASGLERTSECPHTRQVLSCLGIL
jgi:glycosyltransferase A (GT-A) superfamily protein (DUF2064 family)